MENSKVPFQKTHNILVMFILLTVINSTRSHGSYTLVENVTVPGPVSSVSFIASLSKFIISRGSKLRIYQASNSAATFQGSEYDTNSILFVSEPTIQKVVGINETLNFMAIIEEGHLVLLSSTGL